MKIAGSICLIVTVLLMLTSCINSNSGSGADQFTVFETFSFTTDENYEQTIERLEDTIQSFSYIGSVSITFADDSVKVQIFTVDNIPLTSEQHEYIVDLIRQNIPELSEDQITIVTSK